jgi:hypothetical protein
VILELCRRQTTQEAEPTFADGFSKVQELIDRLGEQRPEFLGEKASPMDLTSGGLVW